MYKNETKQVNQATERTPGNKTGAKQKDAEGDPADGAHGFTWHSGFAVALRHARMDHVRIGQPLAPLKSPAGDFDDAFRDCYISPRPRKFNQDTFHDIKVILVRILRRLLLSLFQMPLIMVFFHLQIGLHPQHIQIHHRYIDLPHGGCQPLPTDVLFQKRPQIRER